MNIDDNNSVLDSFVHFGGQSSLDDRGEYLLLIMKSAFNKEPIAFFREENEITFHFENFHENALVFRITKLYVFGNNEKHDNEEVLNSFYDLHVFFRKNLNNVSYSNRKNYHIYASMLLFPTSSLKSSLESYFSGMSDAENAHKVSKGLKVIDSKVGNDMYIMGKMAACTRLVAESVNDGNIFQAGMVVRKDKTAVSYLRIQHERFFFEGTDLLLSTITYALDFFYSKIDRFAIYDLAEKIYSDKVHSHFTNPSLIDLDKPKKNPSEVPLVSMEEIQKACAIASHTQVPVGIQDKQEDAEMMLVTMPAKYWKEAEEAMANVGIEDASTACKIFLAKVKNCGGLPFEMKSKSQHFG
jgi:hypothetical protein